MNHYVELCRLQALVNENVQHIIRMDNALVDTKNKLYDLINEDTDESIGEAIKSLEALAPLWVAGSYSYKGLELCTRLQSILWCWVNKLHHRATKQSQHLSRQIERVFQLQAVFTKGKAS